MKAKVTDRQRLRESLREQQKLMDVITARNEELDELRSRVYQAEVERKRFREEAERQLCRAARLEGYIDRVREVETRPLMGVVSNTVPRGDSISELQELVANGDEAKAGRILDALDGKGMVSLKNRVTGFDPHEKADPWDAY